MEFAREKFPNKKLVPHIASRRIRDEFHLQEIVDRVSRSGITNPFFIGGDGQKDGRFGKAMDVMGHFVQHGVALDRIGVAGYPTGNAVIDENPTQLLLEKQIFGQTHRLSTEIVTQVCFRAEGIVQWLEEIRLAGVMLPVIVGVPGVLSPKNLIKLVLTVGVEDTARLANSKPELLAQITGRSLGRYTPGELLVDLARLTGDDHKIEGVSIFTLGNIMPTVKLAILLFVLPLFDALWN